MPPGKSSSTSGGRSCSSKKFKYPINSHVNPFLSDFRPIKENAKGLYERVTADGYVENEKDVAVVSELAEDLQDILLKYRVSIQNPDTARLGR